MFFLESDPETRAGTVAFVVLVCLPLSCGCYVLVMG